MRDPLSNTVKAVSYTHLDVYKRQVVLLVVINVIPAIYKKKRGQNVEKASAATGVWKLSLIHI